MFCSMYCPMYVGLNLYNLSFFGVQKNDRSTTKRQLDKLFNDGKLMLCSFIFYEYFKIAFYVAL